MAELSASDVYEFTGGRLADDDGDGTTTDMLKAALTAARRECGWHVCPVKTETVIIDGPDSRILNLPTRKLNAVASVEEDGVSLNVSNLRWSAGGPPGLLSRPCSMRKVGRGWWTPEYQGVEITMTHGYTEAEAADWRHAVLSMVDQIGMVLTGGISQDMLVRKTVDDVTYGYANPFAAAADDALYSVNTILDDYRLPRLEFL